MAASSPVVISGFARIRALLTTSTTQSTDIRGYGFVTFWRVIELLELISLGRDTNAPFSGF